MSHRRQHVISFCLYNLRLFPSLLFVVTDYPFMLCVHYQTEVAAAMFHAVSPFAFMLQCV